MMSLSNRSSLSLQHTNHASSVYSLFSIATDLMTYWFGGKNSTVTAEVQSLAERMQLPEDVSWMPSLDHQDAHLRSSSTRRLTGAEMEFQVNTYTMNNQYEPAIAALTDGGFVVTWTSDEQGICRLYSQLYTVTGSQQGPQFHVGPTTRTCASPAAAALLVNGELVVTRSGDRQSGENGHGVYGQRYTTDGVPSGGEFLVVDTFASVWSPDVTALADGGFIVTWWNLYGYTYGQLYTVSDVQNGVAFILSTYASRPAITSLTDGGFVAIYSKGSGSGVYGQRYMASGVASGAEFRVNTYTTGDQYAAAVTALANGGFLATWNSDQQDGSGYGVYAQRFDAAGNKIAPPTARPSYFPSSQPTLLPTITPSQPTESLTDQPKTSSASLAVKDRIEALFTPMVILIAAISAGGLIGLIACACFIVRSRQKTNMRLTQPSFDLLPSADDGLASTPVHTSPRDQRQECLREVELPTASFSGSASSPASVETSRQISRGQLHSPSSAHALPSTIPLIPSAELIIDYTQCLGEGGFGIVYKGTWQTTSVAVKQLKVKRLPKTVLDSFHEEAMHHASFRHPNILLLYGICLDAPSPSMVMELMTISLYYFLHSYDDFPWSMRLTVAKDVASGLQFLHSRQTLHRDLKSHNVMLDQQHQAKLSDFGLSKTRTGVSSSMPNSTPGTAGTLHWMAPEILGIDANHTELSDVYALGMVFWEISSREFPFQEYENGNRSDLLRQFIKEGERPTIPAATPPTFAALIARCWAQRAEDRPVCADIVNELNGGGIAAMSSSLTLRRAPTSGVSIDFAEPMPSTSSI